jgi:hypothetical protein
MGGGHHGLERERERDDVRMMCRRGVWGRTEVCVMIFDWIA